MKARLAVAAIENAVARREDVAGCILHTDRGSQFRSRKVHRSLARHRMVGSMGQVSSAGDNAAMESFFCSSRTRPQSQRWGPGDELRIAIVTWIQRTYHPRRRQAALGRLTPSSSKQSSPRRPLRRPNRTCHRIVQQTLLRLEHFRPGANDPVAAACPAEP